MKTFWLISYSIIPPKAIAGGSSTFTWSFYMYATFPPSIKQCKRAVFAEAFKPDFMFGYDEVGINSIQDRGTDRPELSDGQFIIYSDDLPIEEA